MITPYETIALIIAGMSLVTGIIGITIGMHKYGEKLDLIFGIMGLCLFCFFVLPPVGFIFEDKAPYSSGILVKRVFNFGFSALLPWFICQYTRLSKEALPVFITALVVITYLTMLFTQDNSPRPLWSFLVMVILAVTNVFGFYAGVYQYRNGDKLSARWFLAAMIIYTVVFVLSLINQPGDDYF